MKTLAFPNEGNAYIGLVYFALKDYERAFDYFIKAAKNHEGVTLVIPSIFRDAAPEMLNDPRTIELLKMIGLPN